MSAHTGPPAAGPRAAATPPSLGSDGIDVVDCHVHVVPWEVMTAGARRLLERGRDAARLAALREISRDPARLVERMDAAGVSRAGLVGYVSPDVMGYPREINDWIAGYVAAAPDRLFGYGSVHPRFTDDPAADMDHVLGRLRMTAIKVHPSHQQYAPNDYLHGLEALRVVYAKAQDYGVPLAVHTGTSTFPQARNRLAEPLLVEDVAIDFPRLTLILAHAGRPFWTEQAFFLVRRFPQVYLDVSGIPPRHLLSRYLPRLREIADKTLYGSDWAGPGVPDFADVAAEFRVLPLERGPLAAILAGNAHRVFGFGASAARHAAP